MTAPTQDHLKSILHYDPDSGQFVWLKACPQRGKVAGTIVGTNDDLQYRQIEIDGRAYKAHRLAWLYMTGEWPDDHVDHKDRDGLNNRWNNLREATRSQNKANGKCYASSSVGLKGVSRHGRGWRARVSKDGRRVGLGVFDTPEQAHAAYVAAAINLHGEFARAA